MGHPHTKHLKYLFRGGTEGVSLNSQEEFPELLRT